MTTFDDVMRHYGFQPDAPPTEHSVFTSWVHPSATDKRDRACSVLILGGRAIVHCQLGSPIYSVTPHDVEFLLRREFSCFSCLPAIAQA